MIDGEGKPITDPTKIVRGEGGFLPLGGTPAHGIYKGFGLSIVVDILCGILSGSVTSILREYTPETRGNYSDHFFGAIRIDGFLPVNEFKEKVDATFEAYENLPRLPGVGRITIPGPYEDEIVKDRKANGVPLEPKTVQDLKELAEELGIEFDL